MSTCFVLGCLHYNFTGDSRDPRLQSAHVWWCLWILAYPAARLQCHEVQPALGESQRSTAGSGEWCLAQGFFEGGGEARYLCRYGCVVCGWFSERKFIHICRVDEAVHQCWRCAAKLMPILYHGNMFVILIPIEVPSTNILWQLEAEVTTLTQASTNLKSPVHPMLEPRASDFFAPKDTERSGLWLLPAPLTQLKLRGDGREEGSDRILWWHDKICRILQIMIAPVKILYYMSLWV